MSGPLAHLWSLFAPGSVRAREDSRWFFIDPLPSGAYNRELLRSRSDGDFVAHPDYLWTPALYLKARSGLNGHVRELADRLGGVVTSDALIVLHPEDFVRTEASWLASWPEAAERELRRCFERLVEREGFTRAWPDRPLQVRVIRDGDPLLGCLAGVQRGEFATALPANLYLGPVETSAPLVEVFVADERGRFASVGTMYSDQLAFTVGSHALDNARIERLGDSALYTLHRFPGEAGLHHKVHADRAERVVIETGRAHGGETVRLVDRGRDEVLLEVMLVSARDLDAELPRADDARPLGAPLGLPGFLPAGPGEGTILPEGLELGTIGAFSILPESLPHPVHRLQQRAHLLQRVQFKAEMRGYRLELDRGGDLGPEAADPVARLEVVEDRVGVVSLARDLSLDGVPLPEGERRPLREHHELQWRGGSCHYRPLRRSGDARFPYLARLDGIGRSTPLPEGEAWTVGRDSQRCDVPLPDRPGRGNILWRDGATEGPVEVQGGRADRARFRTDAICVASRAASLDLSGPPALENLSPRCPLYILRGRDVLRLKGGARVPLEPGDELLIGNQLFTLDAPGRVEAPSPVQRLSPARERQQEGPGSKGRRPRIGGAPGALVDRPRTYRAALGLRPDDPAQPPVRAPRVEPVVPAPRPVPQLAPAVARVEVDDGSEALRPFDLPTHQLPSLSLDPSRDSWFDGLGDDLLDATPTIVDESPDWHALLSAARLPGALEVSATRDPGALEVPATRDPGALEVPATLTEHPTGPPPPVAPRPRGLRLDAAIPPGPSSRRFRGSAALPGFGPMAPRRPTPSVSGD